MFEDAHLEAQYEDRYEDFSDVIEEIYGNTFEDCPGHYVGEGDDATVTWCDFTEPCS